MDKARNSNMRTKKRHQNLPNMKEQKRSTKTCFCTLSSSKISEPTSNVCNQEQLFMS